MQRLLAVAAALLLFGLAVGGVLVLREASGAERRARCVTRFENARAFCLKTVCSVQRTQACVNNCNRFSDGELWAQCRVPLPR